MTLSQDIEIVGGRGRGVGSCYQKLFIIFLLISDCIKKLGKMLHIVTVTIFKEYLIVTPKNALGGDSTRTRESPRSRAARAQGAGHRSGLWPYPPLGATHSFSIVTPSLRANRSKGKVPPLPPPPLPL